MALRDGAPWTGFWIRVHSKVVESSCPNCKKKNEHEDYLFEVACSCGSRYNPFMQLEETPAAAPSAAEPQFAEASAAFADIRNFGDDALSPEIGRAHV